MDSIAVSNATNESFSLYLPNSYQSQKSSAIIFVFDPAARGRVGLAPFVESAEKYGIILVCSNNSRNGSFEKNFATADNLFKYVFKTYRVDVGQMYLAGFSGGSRLATAIASLSGQFSGVIACGAGFSPNPAHSPSFNPFLYAAICGVEDMNYQEILANQKYLTKLKFKNTVFSFDGGHQWPNTREVNRAVDWLFLPNNTGTISQFTKNLIAESFESEYRLTQLFLGDNELLFARENYKRILQTYPEHFGLDSIRSKYKELINSEPFEAASKNRLEALKRELQIRKKLFNKLESDLNSIEEINFNWWEKESEKLHKMERKRHKEIKRMVARVRYGIMAAIYEKRFSMPELIKNTHYKNVVQSFRQMLYGN
ncbi:MAG: hypothetical protein AAGH81_03285 [Bacteroidota bacterium]